MARRSSSSGGCVFVLVVLALGGVAVWFFWDRIVEIVRPSGAPPIVSPGTGSHSPLLSPGRSRTPASSRTPIASPAIPTPAPSLRTEEALTNLASARKLLEEGKAADAVKLLERTAAFPLSDATAKEVGARLTEARDFAGMLALVTLSPVVSGGKILRVNLKSGGKLEGLVESDELGTIVLRTFGGVSITVQRKDVASTEPLTVEGFKAGQRELLKNMVNSAKQAGGREWMPWWNAFRHARTYDLFPECWEVFREGRGRHADLHMSAREYQSFKIYRLALHYFGRGMNSSAFKAANDLLSHFPDTSYAPQARELVDIIVRGTKVPVAALDPASTPSPRPSPAPSSAPPSAKPGTSPTPQPTPPPTVTDRPRALGLPKADTADLKKANELYTKGEALIRKAFEYMDKDDYPKAREAFTEAVQVLMEARDLYEGELRGRPERRDLEDFIEQVNKLIYLANKSKPLGVW